MTLLVGVGRSDSHSADAAGRSAAEEAMRALGGREAALVLVFATTGYVQHELLAAIREVTGKSPLVGCSGSGVITQAGSQERSHAVGLLVLGGDSVRATPVLARNSAQDGRACARSIAEQVKKGRGTHDAAEERVLLLFADGLTTNCADLLAGLGEELPGLPIAGGNAGDTFTFERTYQYLDGEAVSDAVSGVLLSGDLSAEIAVSHGCEVIGLEQVITRAEGGWVHQISGRPAWSFFKEYLDESAEGLDALNIAYLCLAERLPEELHAEYGEFIIRVPLRLNAETGALFFGGALATGARVHVALRQADAIASRAVDSAAGIARRRDGQKPSLMLQFDCVGRGRLLFGDDATEQLIEPVQRLLGKDVPWLGFHSYGEFAPIGAAPYFHNFTVVFLALFAGSPSSTATTRTA